MRVTLWGRLGHDLSEDVIGCQTIMIVTSTMVQKCYSKSNNVTIYSVISRHKI